jgi:hypothetical protein
VSHPRSLAVLLALVAGCDPAPMGEPDASADAGVDAPPRDAGPPDSGPICEPACTGTLACCHEGSGTACVNLASDIAHCGSCRIDCLATGRGDSCRSSQCGCGSFDLGCLGSMESTCCPATMAREAHCANLFRDAADCGECGRACDPLVGNDCDGARCLCGGERRGCAGTPEDRCCLDFVGAHVCADTTSDPRHCGTCGMRCGIGIPCVGGVCVRPDAGPRDAGPPDGGAPDAGADGGDAGT